MLPPQSLVQHGLQAIHRLPMAGDVKCRNPWSKPLPVAAAMRQPHIDLANAGSSYASFTLDCDSPSWASALGDHPYPSIIVQNRDNHRAHLTWCITNPVHCYTSARAAPLRFLADVNAAYTRQFGSDPGYGGRLTKNPLHANFIAIPAAARAYTLTDLASAILKAGPRLPREVDTTRAGRNCSLFTEAMRYASRNRGDPVLPFVVALNESEYGTAGLDQRECESIARSVERYRTKWQRHTMSFTERQAMRGKRSKRPPAPDSERTTAPWLAMGISRRTYYRRKARGLMPSGTG